MTQREFIDLSRKEVKSLNGGYGNLDNHSESWRGGYEFARQQIFKSLQEKNYDEFLSEVENFATQDLDVFE